MSRSRRSFAQVLLVMAIATSASSDPRFEPTGSVLDPLLTSVERTVLPNGLTLLVRPEPGTGVVAINTWVEAGYFHEPDEVAGMAHLFEHMFFKGSARFPGAEQIAQELSRVGGQSNAGTIYDSTNYYFVLPQEGFERGLEIQADAIMNPLFDPAELAKEAEVVIEESNRKLDNPPAVSMERMFATAFEQHRMRRWRIGSNEVLRSIDREDLLAFFQTLYRPENMILSIAGDVTVERVREAVARTFGEIPRGALKKESGPSEPEQTAFRYARSSADIQQGYTVFGWHTPAAGADDELALEVLATILGDGKASRLYRAVVGPDAASTVSAFNWPTEEVGVFVVQASFDEAHRPTVDRRVMHEVERVRAHGPTAFELRLATNVIESRLLMGLQTALGQARSLAEAEARGGYREMGVRLAELSKLTPKDVRRAARTYLTIPNLTLYHYGPNGAPQTTTRAEALALVQSVAQAESFEPEKALPLPEAPPPIVGANAAGGPTEMRLANGLSVVIQERPGAPVVAVGISFRGGRTGESSVTAGTTQLMGEMMRRGTTTRSAEQINREIQLLGSEIGFDAEADAFSLGMTIVRRNLEPGIELLADVVLNPTFPKEELAEAQALQVAAIRRAQDSSFQRPFQLLLETHYGNHPYALPASGYESSVNGVRRDDLVAWWQRWVRAGDAVLVIVGDVDAGEAQRLARTHFEALPVRTAAPLPVLQPSAPPHERMAIERRDRKQSAIAVAFPSVTRAHADWPSLRLLQDVTSGLAGTFFAELRGNRSLAYTVFAREAARADAGAFVGYLATGAEKEDEALAALLAEFARLDEDGIGQADLARAQAHLAGSTRIRRQTNDAIAADLAEAWTLGLGLDAVERMLEAVRVVDLDQIRAVAGRTFDAEPTIAIVRGKNE